MSKTLVGIRPSGEMHLGHYASVIKPAIKTNAEVLIAKYHAYSEDVEDNIRYTIEVLRNFGHNNYRVQEIDIDLYFKLLNVSPSHLLNAMPQYKAKEKTAHMFLYPVLMAHDLAGYDRVIVGEDQRPHIEFANDVLPRVGYERIEGVFDGGKIMSLKDPTKKMSSSEPDSCLFLYDFDAERKIRKAVTTAEGRANLENIYKLLGGDRPPESNSDLKAVIYERYKML